MPQTTTFSAAALPTSVRPPHLCPPAARAAGLSRPEETSLIRQAQGGCERSLERLIEANIRLVYSVARRYRCRSYSLDDLVQEGTLGLILAVSRFDTERGFRLNTYALHWIRQAISRAAEQNDRLIHVPAQTSAEIRRVHRIQDSLTAYLGRTPTVAELACASGVPEDRLVQLTGTVQDPVSLEALVGAEQDAVLMELAEDANAVSPEADALSKAVRSDVRRLLGLLRDKERAVVAERYGLDGQSPCTLDEISRRLRISREGVRQIEARAIRKLRHALHTAQWE